MIARTTIAVFAGAAMLVGCGPAERGASREAAAVAQTGFPGQVTAGGGTSGDVIARTQAKGTNPNEAGTPGIPKGAGGNTGGAATGETVKGSSSLAGAGEKSPAQSAKGEIEAPKAGTPPSPAAR